MIPMILVCVAVILLAAPGYPSPPACAAFVLALIALIMVILRWHSAW